MQKRWKVLREKFSVAYRKFKLDGIPSNWELYETCKFLEPFVNLKPDNKKFDDQEEPLLIEKRSPPKSPFDESTLTTLVMERPVLYDKQHEDFRASNMRKKAWLEISTISEWDVPSLQKRWRVMRDRFVRELRRTKNIENEETPINCSAFFRDMLFLVRHVKSKKYEAEATDLSPDASQEKWDQEESGDGSRLLAGESFETCIIPEIDSASTENVQILEETTTDGSAQVVTYAIDDNDQYVECFETADASAPEVYDESSNDNLEGEDYYEEASEASPEKPQQVSESDDEVAVQEISEEQWFKEEQPSVEIKKRPIPFDIEEDRPKKRRATESPEPSTSSECRNRSSYNNEQTSDEDAAFGSVIGLMLKKIPSHLKTSIKLTLLQGFADFEVKHKLH